jgi:hypothetical protein
VAALTLANHSDTGLAVHVDRVSRKTQLQGIAASVGNIADGYHKGLDSITHL